MTGTISFGGIGSGVDTEGIVSGLVSASSGTLNALKKNASDTDSAVSTLSSISGLLSTLRTSVAALSDARDAASYSATSSSSAIAVSANGTAQAGAYDIDVIALAREQRNYSKAFSASSDTLGQRGQLSLQVGTATSVDIDIDETDTLDSIAAKINASGARVSAAVFNDGTSNRLQVRGLDTGAANGISFIENGVDLGFNAAGSKVQSAQDAQVKIDGFTVTRPTNQIAGAIQGVTLALTQTTTSPVTVTVATDASGLQKKLQSVVDAYNAVLTKIHSSAGYGTTKATNTVLSGDSALRSITDRLGSALLTQVKDAGTFSTLGSIGLKTNNDGTLSLDSTKLSAALTKDSASITALLAGPASGKGVMDILNDLTTSVTASNGTLALHSDSLSSRAKSLRDQADTEQARLDRYAESLRTQFTNMDTTVATNQSLLSYLQNLG